MRIEAFNAQPRIIQAEAGSVLVNATGSSSDQSSGAGEGGADDKGGGNK